MHESEKSKLSRSVVSIATPWTAAHHCKYASPNLENVYFSSLFYRGLGKEDGDGTGNPHQYSCLETPMDGGAWWAAVHGFTQSRTRLKQLSERNGNPLQYSCLENPRDGRGWWAAVYGVAQSQTWLKQLSSSSSSSSKNRKYKIRMNFSVSSYYRTDLNFNKIF